MFDPTGVLEVFVLRFDTDVQISRYDLSPPPLSPTEDDVYAIQLPTQAKFHLVAYLTERFDWLGEEAVSITFAIDGAYLPTTQYIRMSDSLCLPLHEFDREDLSFDGGGFTGLQRVQMVSTTLEPLNAIGCPLETQESCHGQFSIELMRGSSTTNTSGSEQFLRAGGPAGFPVTITFDYNSQSRGIVQLSSPSTLVSADNLLLALGRFPRLGCRRRDSSGIRSRAKRSKVEDDHHSLSGVGATYDGSISLTLPQQALRI